MVNECLRLSLRPCRRLMFPSQEKTQNRKQDKMKICGIYDNCEILKSSLSPHWGWGIESAAEHVSNNTVYV